MKVLLVEDEKIARVSLARTLARAGHDVTACETVPEAMERIALDRFDVVLSDLRLPGGSGLDVLRASRARDPEAAVLLMTAFATVETAVEAIKLGAHDYLTKPFSPDQVLIRLEKIGELREVRSENVRLRKTIEGFRSRPIVGSSQAMQRLLETVRVVAGRDTTVLVEGESGTGKELVARELHRFSDRSEAPFVAVNCAAIPETLLESELFGHEKGAFTGALGRHAGYFERADGGTIFIDDVDDVSLALQVKLLRVLQEREVVRVGGQRSVKVDIRVVCATKVRLLDLVAQKRFRDDLYYRLAIVPIHVPPLRSRKDDIPALLDHFFSRYGADGPARERLAVCLPELLRHDWPGNVRELENVAQRIIALPRVGPLELFASRAPSAALPADAPEGSLVFPLPASGGRVPYRETMEAADRHLIQWALEKAGGRVTGAADLLDLPRSTLRSKIEKYGLASTDS